MAVCVKYNKFLEQLGKKCYDFSADTLKFALTNVAPDPATQTVFLPGSIQTPPAAANGYTAGGHAATIASWVDSAGVTTLACTTDIVITATTGGIGPFRYVILYDDTTTSPLADPLIAYWDYGSSITLGVGETFTIDVTNTLFTLS